MNIHTVMVTSSKQTTRQYIQSSQKNC